MRGDFMKKECAIVYCESAFSHPVKGKTARGLTRFTERYQIISVIDSELAGKDSGEYLDEKTNSIPIVSSLEEALERAKSENLHPTCLIVGIATNGGKFRSFDKPVLKKAIELKLNIVSGLHEFLTEDHELTELAKKNGVSLKDVRKIPSRNQLHFYSGKIREVKSFRIAVLGTDSGIGKRTTAWLLVQGLRKRGISSEMIGTGQTAWLQGAKYSTVIDSLINDFTSGELEEITYRAFKETHPDTLVIEGQSSLLHPGYPGGSEIIVGTRPDVIILQHAPGRKTYEGVPDVEVHPLKMQIQALELIAQKPVIAITINHENMNRQKASQVCHDLSIETGLPVTDVLWDRSDKLIEVVLEKFAKHRDFTS